jgi:hypothetical protein
MAATEPVALVASHLKQMLAEDCAEHKESHEVDLLIEKYYFDPEYRELCDLRRKKENVELEVLVWRRIVIVENGGTRSLSRQSCR